MMVTGSVVAEAGLSECVCTDTQCLPGFGLLVAAGAATGMFVLVWLAAALAATVDVAGSRPGVPRATLWVLVVWTVPVVGALAWYRRRRTGDADRTAGGTPPT
ncbi:PLDc N-terminal domain-containing protein [Rhodococcus aetherivorans]|uniref:PLDc N-terminal domain-containing protein n=1 Tax=Rhodococcus aetherivorans TaxID=191292 RepID=UPI001E2BEEB2|nr:PLDc N-terminal domain-containing protein [Rhodococcus aetherivorans]MDV6296173.1 PLDc N-terminal domain-containing protein [Rhodococcus aetherivorans]UGQ43574.1 PLDc N-terminal domain-containing protein [Rhodococcus aetherivorans]